MRILRQYQHDAITAIREAFKRGLRGTIVVMPTGLGKAMVIATVAKLVLAKGKRVLVLVNRDNLVEQLRESLIEQGMMPLIERGMDKASPMSDCVIGSIQTLQGKRLKRWNSDHFDLIFCDECHGSAANSFHNVLDYFLGQHVGCTATPERHDKEGLWKGYVEICYQKTFAEAVEEGWLCDFEFHELPVPIFVSDEAAKKRMWTEADETLSLANDLPRIFEAGAIASEGRKCLAFWSNCHSSLEADKYFKSHGLESMHIEGPGGPASMNREKVNEIIEWFKEPSPRVLHNCQLLTTGFDQPDIDQILMGRLVRSEPLMRQMLGRGTRAACVIDGLPDAEARKSVIAASAKPICIAEGSLVLTDSGLVPIQDVTLEHKVWDGACFVAHDGVVFNGEQETITYAGLTATPEHRCWTMGGWKTLSACEQEETPLAVTGAGWHPLWESDFIFIGDTPRAWRGENASKVPDLWRRAMAQPLYCKGKFGWLQEVRPSSTGSLVAIPPTGGRASAMRKSQKQSIREVWRARDSFLLQFTNGGGCLGNEQSGIASRIGTGSNRQLRKLRDRKPALRNQTTKSLQHEAVKTREEVSSVSIATPGNPICRRDTLQVGREVLLLGNHSAIQPPVHKTKRRVWDILNCGPGNRFTVNGVLVHNCRVQDLMVQLGEVRNRFADASVLITSDEKERKFIKELTRNSNHPFTMAELEGKLRAKRETDKEAHLAKLLEDTANAQHKARMRLKWNGQGPYVDYILKMGAKGGVSKPASEKQVSYLRHYFKYKGEIPSLFHASLLISAYKRHEEKMNQSTIQV